MHKTAKAYLALGIFLKLSRWAEVGFLARLTHAACDIARPGSIFGVDISSSIDAQV